MDKMRSPQKPKSTNQKNLLEELAQPLRDLVNDIKVHGAASLEKVRERDPAKYLELATKLLPLVAALNPKASSYDEAQSRSDIAEKLLQSVGLAEPDEQSVEEAVRANDQFIATLEAIRDAAQGAIEDERHFDS
jgi:hypothetical protein